MSLDTPRSRTWAKIAADSRERVAKRTLQLYRTLSKNNSSLSESETMEIVKANLFSNRGFSSQETEELRQSNVYDEKAFAAALKDINTELESLRSLYNSPWFTDMRKSSDKTKNQNQAAHVEMHTSTGTIEQLPGKTSSSNELHISKNQQNYSGMQNSTALMPTALFQQQHSAFEQEVNELIGGQKILPSHSEKQFGDDMKFDKKRVEIPANTAMSTNAHTGVADLYYTSKKAVDTRTVFSEVPTRKEGSYVNSMLHTETQNKFSGLGKTQLYNNFTQMLCEVDKITNELTEVQNFRDALYAKNAEAENKDVGPSKMSATLTMPRSKFSHSASKVQTVLQRAPEKRLPQSCINITIRETNRKVSKQKIADSPILYNSRLPKKAHNTQADKQKKFDVELLNRREMQEKKKGTGNHSLQSTKQKSLAHSFSDDKNRNPQPESENDLPLEVNSLQVNTSFPLVSRHYATNKISTKSSSKTFKPVVLK